MFTSCGEYEIGGGCDGIGKERERAGRPVSDTVARAVTISPPA